MKKVLSVLLIMAMISVAFSGCKENASATSSATSVSSQEEKKGITFPLEKKVTYTMFCTEGDYNVQLQNVKAWQEREKATNVYWEIESCPRASASEKVSLMLSGGTYPDVTTRFCGNVEMFKDQVYIPLDELIREYAPNLCALQDKDNTWEYLAATNGKIYGLPYYDLQMPQWEFTYINTKWLKNLNLEMPNNPEQFYQVLKAFKEQDANGNGNPNDEIPFIGNKDVGGGTDRALLPYFIPLDQGKLCYVQDGKLSYALSNDSYKDYLSFLNRIYKEEILDKNTFTQTWQQQGSIGMTGDIIGCATIWKTSQVVTSEHVDDYAIIPPFDGVARYKKVNFSANQFCITDSAKNPEIIIAWADQFFDEVGMTEFWLGRKNEDYTIGSDGKWSRVRPNDTMTDDEITDNVGYVWKLSLGKLSDFFYNNMPKCERLSYVNAIKAVLPKCTGGYFPKLSFTEDEQKKISDITADINVYTSQYRAQITIGELDLNTTWNKYLKKLDDMRLQELLKIYNDAYVRAK